MGLARPDMQSFAKWKANSKNINSSSFYVATSIKCQAAQRFPSYVHLAFCDSKSTYVWTFPPMYLSCAVSDFNAKDAAPFKLNAAPPSLLMQPASQTEGHELGPALGLPIWLPIQVAGLLHASSGLGLGQCDQHRDPRSHGVTGVPSPLDTSWADCSCRWIVVLDMRKDSDMATATYA